MSCSRRTASGFTLVEALVAAVLVSIGVVSVFSGITAIRKASVQVAEAELLQELALQKWYELQSVGSLNSVETEGDFEEVGYPDITWELTVEPSGVAGVDRVTLTTMRADRTQALSGLLFARSDAITVGAAGG